MKNFILTCNLSINNVLIFFAQIISHIMLITLIAAEVALSNKRGYGIFHQTISLNLVQENLLLK